MKKLFALTLFAMIGTLAMLPSVAKAQAVEDPPKTSLAWEYGLRDKQWSPIVTQQIGTLTRVPVLKFLDVSLLGGVAGGTNGAPTFGAMLSRSFPVADQASILLGITGRITQARPPQLGGIVFGVSFSFRS